MFAPSSSFKLNTRHLKKPLTSNNIGRQPGGTKNEKVLLKLNAVKLYQVKLPCSSRKSIFPRVRLTAGAGNFFAGFEMWPLK